MTENKKFIVFFSIASAICLILTYLFSIIEVSADLINDDFLVVAFGGLFGSFGVMLLSEIKKYCLNKRAAEDVLYYTLLQLYSELIVEIKNTDVYLEHKESPVPGNLYSGRVPVIRGLLYSLQRLDYEPFLKNALKNLWEPFRQNELHELDNHVIMCNSKLFLAINHEQIKALDTGKMHYHPTACDHDVDVTLRKMKMHASDRAKAIDDIKKAVSIIGKNRFHWQEDKKRVDSLYIGLPTENPELLSFFED